MSDPTQPELQANVRGIFPTPVAVAMVPDAAGLNEALLSVIHQRRESHASKDHSNLGGWQSSWDFFDWGGPALDELLAAAKSVAARLTADRHGRPVQIDWKVNCWANINRKGQANEYHTHPGAYWSGTYYVDDGRRHDEEDVGGEFEMQDPRGVAPAMYAPHLAFAMPGGQSVGAGELIVPRTGMMVLFPSWLSHQVRPFKGEGERVSIAFNFSL